MNSLSRILSKRPDNIRSNTSSSNNSKEIIISKNYEKSVQNWNLPVESSVYKRKGILDTNRSDYVIKTVEESLNLGMGFSSFKLLSKSLIEEHRKNYNYLHIGLVQIGLKPATRIGLNTSALIAVRDKRHLRFHDSLLGIVESSLCDGPIYFSCFPNYVLALEDETLIHALSLDIRTEGFNMAKKAKNVILIYRIQYKVMNTAFPRCKEIPYQEENQTTLFVTNLEKSNVRIPQTIKWDQVKLPEIWLLDEANEPEKPEQRELEDIIEHPNGDVVIRFASNRITRLNLGESSRNSTSSVPMTNFEKSNIQGTSFAPSGVNYPEYKVEIPPSEKIRRTSPSPSEMGYSDFSINVLSLDGDKDFDSFYSKENSLKRKWFSLKNEKSQNKWFSQYKRFLKKMDYKDTLGFFEFLKEMYILQKIEFPDFEDKRFISTIESSYANFRTTSGRSVKSIHPPEMNLSIETKDGKITASHYKGNTEKIGDVISQNNYTNLYLKSLGEQMNRIERISQNSEIQSFEGTRDSKVLFKPMPSEKLDIKFSPNVSSEMIEEIAKRLNNLDIKECAPLNQETDSESSDESENSEQEDLIDLEKEFTNLRINDNLSQDPLEVNKLSTSYQKKMVYNDQAKA
ncbi:hypothetical protein SASPL_135572 [Salvia splendens]|uniref:Movement protein n=1 Tax=Salvia splendens TaxID=180675 RepID=A0A8X8X005_SALSN|nr:hypothetical protein SASPL_135572 [Salvia splendens]